MRIPNKKKQPYTYGRWEEMDLLKATDIERILMLELSQMEAFHQWMFRKTWWDLKDMREFVRSVSKKIMESIKNEKTKP